MSASPSRHKVWVHTAETVVLLGSGALAAVAILPLAGLPGWVLPVTEALVAVVVAVSIYAATSAGRLATFAFFMGAFLAGWTVWAEITRVWNAATITALLSASVIFAPWGTLAVLAMHCGEDMRKAIERSPDGEADAKAEMARFEAMFAKAGQADVQVLELRESKAGRLLTLLLPRSGKVTLASLEGCASSFEVSLQAQPGAVEFAYGSHSGEVIMRIREKYVLNEVRKLKPEYYASTVNEPFAIGVEEDGGILKITLRELHLFMAGTTGAGKSTLINVIIAQMARCTDTLIWMIDMKGGRTAKPWVQAWANGETGSPAIDWVATTREEASMMMAAFMSVINSRMNSGAGGSKIVPSPSMPQIILITDETADILGYLRGTRKQVGEDATTNSEFIRLAEEINQKARSEAATTIWATQRGTNDMAGSGTLKSLCKLRIALGTSTVNDLRYVIPDAKVTSGQCDVMANTPGVGMVAVQKRISLLTRFFLLDHIEEECGKETDGKPGGCVKKCEVYRTSIEVGRGDRRPMLDKISAAPLGADYTQRWDRAARAGWLERTAKGATAVADVDTTDFEGIMRAGGFSDEDVKTDPRRLRARAILESKGVNGATPKLIMDTLQLEGMPAVREVLQRWLADDEKAGLVHRADYGRWVCGPGREDKTGGAAA